MTRESFIDESGTPSAILSDGLVMIRLFAVSSISLSETYHLPPIGTSTVRSAVATHDDVITLNGLLVGSERFELKFALETLAESSKRGTALEGLTRGAVSGLVLISGMTVRTDMQIESLAFSASAQRRDVIEVTVTLAHMPRPGPLTKLLEVRRLSVRSLADFSTVPSLADLGLSTARSLADFVGA
jgi:hypothetical protein